MGDNDSEVNCLSKPLGEPTFGAYRGVAFGSVSEARLRAPSFDRAGMSIGTVVGTPTGRAEDAWCLLEEDGRLLVGSVSGHTP